MKVFIVYSGKGGVGKTTTTVNIARTLAEAGNKVFILDADVNTPSIPVIFPEKANGNIQCASIGYQTKKSIYLTDSSIRSYISECINEINGYKPDYVLIDTPPSITDVHIGLIDKIKSSGLLIVTQPNELSVTDVNRTALFFKERGVPILGIVENMCVTKKVNDYTWKTLGSVPFSKDFNQKTVYEKSKKIYKEIADSIEGSDAVLLENKKREIFDETVTIDDIHTLEFSHTQDVKFVNVSTWDDVREILQNMEVYTDQRLIECDGRSIARMVEPFKHDTEAFFMITNAPSCEVKTLPGEIGVATLFIAESYYGMPRLKYRTAQGEIVLFSNEVKPVDNKFILECLADGYRATKDGRYLPSKSDMQEVHDAFGMRVGMNDDWEQLYDDIMNSELPTVNNGLNDQAVRNLEKKKDRKRKEKKTIGDMATIFKNL